VTTSRTRGGWLVAGAIAAAAVAVVVLGPVTRGPGFHVYADQRTWRGIPHAGDVLSNLGFLLVAAHYLRHQSRALPGAGAAIGGVALIGLGSGAYHWAPCDALLVLDWAPIAITLMIVLSLVIRDRLGDVAGGLARLAGPVAAIGAVIYWYATGGTEGGDMAPYVALQLLGVGLAPSLALVAPGRIGAGWLVAGVAGFLLARLFARHDAAILDAIGVSGHSLKHVAAALAAGLALRALMRPRA
jgi:hypothetical protein